MNGNSSECFWVLTVSLPSNDERVGGVGRAYCLGYTKPGMRLSLDWHLLSRCWASVCPHVLHRHPCSHFILMCTQVFSGYIIHHQRICSINELVVSYSVLRIQQMHYGGVPRTLPFCSEESGRCFCSCFFVAWFDVLKSFQWDCA